MAHETSEASEKHLKLPMVVASPTDINRLLRELADLDDALLQAKLRDSADPKVVPKTSQLLDETVQLNKLHLLQETDRKALQAYLEVIKNKAPVLHVSLSADPSVGFTTKLVAWLRSEIHPQTLVTIGLQPGIAAGCVIRTTNKRFDLSLRQQFLAARPVLLEKIHTAQVAA